MALAAQRGNVVVVNFFASWCDPCRHEAAALEATWRAYQGQGVQFFGIAYKDVESAAKAFMNEFDVSYPTAIETGNRTSRLYGVTGVPETFVVDQKGNLVHHFVGAVTQAELAQVIIPLLSR
jgi:cytochrome c biogenesis protein CcmG/thiol:disulfide interchange protein DsbE